jgi:hypothetical protein
MGFFDFDWFDDERIVQVGGGVSRIREDSLIRNTTGLVVNAALLNNQDLSEAIRLNEMTGTISSFKRFERVARASSTIGIPTTSFVYSTISKEQLASAIRSSIGQAYPLSSEIEDEDVSSGSITSFAHSKYALQENKAYNLTTNVFTHLGIDYNFTSYVDQFSGSTHTGYTINGTKTTAPFTPVTFTLAVPRPPATASLAATDEFGSPITVTVSIEYWTVYYTHLGREYIWIADLTTTVFSESQVGVNINDNPELEFAPIVPLRNNKTNVTSGTAFTEATKALALLGLEPNAVNAQITQPEVEDVYVTLFSNLITSHMDQLAYNYAFFEYMDNFGIVDESSFNALNNGLLDGSSVYPFNKLSVSKSEVYNNNTSWGYIRKTEGIVGILGADYTYSLADPGVTQWVLGVAVGDYTIRKRTSPVTYDEIFVKNIALSYTVFASEGDVKGFSVPVTPSSGAQVVIPFSYRIALSLPGKYRETLFMRCLHVGIFSKSVQVLEWYQQAWFTDLITIAAIVYAVFSTDWSKVALALELAAEELVLELAFAGIDIGLSTATLIIIANYAVTQIALKLVLAKVLTSGGNNNLLKFLAIAGYAYISIQMSGGDSLSTVKQVLMGGKAVFEGGNILIQDNLKKEYTAFSKEMEALKNVRADLDSLTEKYKAIDAAQANSTEALNIRNLFREAGQGFATDVDVNAYDQRANIADQPDMISQFVANALKLIDPETLIIESDSLLA